MYLVDTDVISTAAPREGAVVTALAEWMSENSDRLFLSVVTIAEICDGIAKTRRQGARRRAVALTQWLETLLHLYHDRVLAFDIPAARIAGELSDRARAKGYAPGFADLAIVATAGEHGFMVLTRNLRHFAPLDVPMLNPFARLP
jgi:toxin FitB